MARFRASAFELPGQRAFDGCASEPAADLCEYLRLDPGGPGRPDRGLAFVTSATIGVWTVGGLEQPLVPACLAWASRAADTVLIERVERLPAEQEPPR